MGQRHHALYRIGPASRGMGDASRSGKIRREDGSLCDDQTPNHCLQSLHEAVFSIVEPFHRPYRNDYGQSVRDAVSASTSWVESSNTLCKSGRRLRKLTTHEHISDLETGFFGHISDLKPGFLGVW